MEYLIIMCVLLVVHVVQLRLLEPLRLTQVLRSQEFHLRVRLIKMFVMVHLLAR